jgi:hypothetical protein
MDASLGVNKVQKHNGSYRPVRRQQTSNPTTHAENKPSRKAFFGTRLESA